MKPFALKGRMTAAAVNDNRLNDCQMARCQRLKQAATYSAAAVQNPCRFHLQFYSLYTPCTEPSLRSPRPLHLPSDSSATLAQTYRLPIPRVLSLSSVYIMCHAVYRHVPRNPPSHPCTNPFALLSTHSL